MRAMLLSDLVVLKKRAAARAALLALSLLGVLVLVNTPLLALLTGVIAALMTVQELAYGEDGARGWAGQRIALPLSRAEIVAGRYASVAAVSAAAIALADVLVMLVTALFTAFPDLGAPFLHFYPLDLPMLAFWSCAGAALALFASGILLPMVLRRGYAGGVPYAACALMLFAMGALSAMGSHGLNLFSHGGLAFDASPEQMALLATGLLMAGIIWYVASAAIAGRIYAKREF